MVYGRQKTIVTGAKSTVRMSTWSPHVAACRRMSPRRQPQPDKHRWLLGWLCRCWKSCRSPAWAQWSPEMDFPRNPRSTQAQEGRLYGKPWENHGKTMGKPWFIWKITIFNGLVVDCRALQTGNYGKINQRWDNFSNKIWEYTVYPLVNAYIKLS